MPSTAPTRFAWCSQWENKISIFELETFQEFSTFDGTFLNKINGILIFSNLALILITISKEYEPGWAHLKEIPNTELIVSVHHSWDVSANLEVFDVSQKEQVKKIYSFEEIPGCRIIDKLSHNITSF